MSKIEDQVDQIVLQTLSEINILQDKILIPQKPTNKVEINALKEQIAEIFNKFIAFNQEHFDTIDKDLKKRLKVTFIDIRDICIKYCTALGLNANFPDHIKTYVDPNTILEFKLSDNTHKDKDKDKMTNIEGYYTLCAKQITKNYDGSYGTLKSFINSINLLKALAGSDTEKKSALVTFLLTKLDQKALEKLPDDVQDIDTIIKCLKEKIKPDTAKVVEGRMIALTSDNKPLLDFQKEAEELAEQYQRSLVVEGIPLNVAEKQAVEKTVELCRKNSRSVEVRAVLNAAHFSSPAEVIAKIATTIDSLKSETTQNRFKKNDKFKNKPNFQNRSGNRNNYAGPSHNNRNNNFSRNVTFSRGQNGPQGNTGYNSHNNNNNGRQNGNHHPNNNTGNNRGGHGGHRPNNSHNFYTMSGNEGFPLNPGGYQQQQQRSESNQSNQYHQ